MSNHSGARESADLALLADLKELVRGVLDEHEQAAVDWEAVTAATSLGSLPLDSLATIELLYSVESRWNIVINEDEAFEFQTVGDVLESIKHKLARAG